MELSNTFKPGPISYHWDAMLHVIMSMKTGETEKLLG